MSVRSPFRVEVALKLKDTIAKKARDRQLRTEENRVKEIFPEQEKGQTRDEIGSLAGVSGKTVDKVEYIQTHAPEAIKEKKVNGGMEIDKYGRIESQIQESA